jgi:catechol 2,3-dioxygenase-like lactoylglutathione lyase family enzyme
MIIAYRCRDSEETREFYEDFLGLPLVSAFEIDAAAISSPFSRPNGRWGKTEGNIGIMLASAQKPLCDKV